MRLAEAIAATCVIGFGVVSHSQTIEVLIDPTGDGAGNLLLDVEDVVVDQLGRVFVSGGSGNNVFRVDPGGTKEQVIDSTGDGMGNELCLANLLAVGPDNSVYVGGRLSDNVFRIAEDGTISHFFDGGGAFFSRPSGIAVDVFNNVYVVAEASKNAFRIDPLGNATMILDAFGDGRGGFALEPYDIAVDQAGTAYVTDTEAGRAFKIPLVGPVEAFFDPGVGPFGFGVYGVDVDSKGNAFFTELFGSKVVRLSPSGAIEAVIEFQGDGTNNLWGTGSPSIDENDALFVTGVSSKNAFRTRGLDSITYLFGEDDLPGSATFSPLRTAARGGKFYVTDVISKTVYVYVGCTPLEANITGYNGSGVNPMGFLAQSEPLTGAFWECDVALSGAQFSAVAFGRTSAMVSLGGFGELLVSPPFLVVDVASGAHSVSIPEDCSLVGQQLNVQGATIEISPLQVNLNNAFEMTIGTF